MGICSTDGRVQNCLKPIIRFLVQADTNAFADVKGTGSKDMMNSLGIFEGNVSDTV